MKKDRVAAFTDAVLAIIMTILVLELEKPSTINLRTFWELRHSFFSYTLSFFWLGSMWVIIAAAFLMVGIRALNLDWKEN